MPKEYDDYAITDIRLIHLCLEYRKSHPDSRLYELNGHYHIAALGAEIPEGARDEGTLGEAIVFRIDSDDLHFLLKGYEDERPIDLARYRKPHRRSTGRRQLDTATG